MFIEVGYRGGLERGERDLLYPTLYLTIKNVLIYSYEKVGILYFFFFLIISFLHFLLFFVLLRPENYFTYHHVTYENSVHHQKKQLSWCAINDALTGSH